MANTNTGAKTAANTNNDTARTSDLLQKANEAAEKFRDEVKNRTDQLGESMGKAKVKVSDNLANAAESVHTKADSAQEYLDGKADKLNDYAHQTIDRANQYGHRTADVLNNSSEFIKNFDLVETKDQLVETLREKPQIGLAIAGIFGLIIGLLIGRRSN